MIQSPRVIYSILVVAASLCYWVGDSSSCFGQTASTPVEVELVDSVDRFEVGGAGKYICFTHKTEKSITVFDVLKNKVKFTIPFNEQQTFCATQDDVLVFDNEKRTISRWSLEFASLAKTEDYGKSLQKVDRAASGSHSAGFVWVFCRVVKKVEKRNVVHTQTRFLDTETLKLTVPPEFAETHCNFSYDKSSEIQTSADGRTIFGGSREHLCNRSGIVSVSNGRTMSKAQLSSSGSYFVTEKGIHDGSGLIHKDLYPAKELSAVAVYGADYFLTFKRTTSPKGPKGFPSKFSHFIPTLREFSTNHELVAFPELLVEGFGRARLLDANFLRRHVICIPEHDAMVVLHPERKILKCHRLNLKDRMAEAGHPKILVVSHPKTAIKRNQPYTYAIKSFSRSRSRKIKVVSGPEKLRINNAGAISWNPVNGQPVNHVTVQIVDEGNASHFHSFEIRVLGKKKASTGTTEKLVSWIPESMRPESPLDPWYAPTVENTDSSIIKLPGPYTDASYGGNGRYVCLFHDRARIISVLDVATRKLIRIIPLANSETVFCSNFKYLFVFDQYSKRVRKFLLSDGSLASTRTLRYEGILVNAGAGSNTSGRLMLGIGNFKDYMNFEVKLHSANTRNMSLSPIKLGTEDHSWASRFFTGKFAFYRLWPTNDGSGFTFGGGRHFEFVEPLVTKQILTRSSSSSSSSNMTKSGRFFATKINSTGKFFTRFGMIYDRQGRPLEQNTKRLGMVHPSMNDDFYLMNSGFERETYAQKATVFVVGQMVDNQRVEFDTEIKLPVENNQHTGGRAVASNPLFFSPRWGSIIATCWGNENLMATSFSLDSVLKNSKSGLLFVESEPPSEPLKVGQKFAYQIRLQKTAKAPRFTLESAPDGMTISSDGNVAWQPSKEAPANSKVIVKIAADGVEPTFHTFDIEVGGGTSAPAIPASKPSSTPVSSRVTSVNFPDGKEFELKLPGKFTSMAMCGSGRFACLKFDELKKLGIIDVSNAKVVGYISFDPKSFKFDVSEKFLFVMNIDEKELTSYELQTTRKVKTVKLNVDGSIKAFDVGSCSESPAMLIHNQPRGRANNLTLIDQVSLEPVEIESGSTYFASSSTYLAAADFGNLYRLGNGKIAAYDPETKFLDLISADEFGKSSNRWFRSLGGYSPNGEFQIVFRSDRRVYPNPRLGKYIPYVDFRLEGIPQMKILGLRSKNPEVIFDRDRPGSGRIIFVPEAGVLVTKSMYQNSLIFQPLKLEDLTKDGRDFLFVSSLPNPIVSRGKQFKYRMEIMSYGGVAELKMLKAPGGMVVDKNGVVTWNVPTDWNSRMAEVEIQITDFEGKSATHVFVLYCAAASRNEYFAEEKQKALKDEIRRIGEVERDKELLVMREEMLRKLTKSDKKIRGFPFRPWLNRDRTEAIVGKFMRMEDGKVVLRDKTSMMRKIALTNLSAFDARIAVENHLINEQIKNDLKSPDLVAARKKAAKDAAKREEKSDPKSTPEIRMWQFQSVHRVLEMINLLTKPMDDSDYSKVFHPDLLAKYKKDPKKWAEFKSTLDRYLILADLTRLAMFPMDKKVTKIGKLPLSKEGPLWLISGIPTK